MAITVLLTPVLQKAEKNVDFTKRLEAATKEIKFCKIHSQLEAIHLNAFLYVLKNTYARKRNNAIIHWHYISIYSIIQPLALVGYSAVYIDHTS